MHPTEELFQVNIAHAGYYLKQAIHQREYLEQETLRMQRSLEEWSPSLLVKFSMPISQCIFTGDKGGYIHTLRLERITPGSTGITAWQGPL